MFGAMARLSGNAGDNESAVHVAVCGFGRKKEAVKRGCKECAERIISPLISPRAIMTPN